MTTYSPGDIVYAPMTYVGQAGSKLRPALVLLDSGDQDIVIARITSRPPRDPYDVRISDWNAAGLRSASTVRLSKVATIPRAQIIKQLGKLSRSDRASVRAVLQKITDLWS